MRWQTLIPSGRGNAAFCANVLKLRCVDRLRRRVGDGIVQSVAPVCARAASLHNRFGICSRRSQKPLFASVPDYYTRHERREPCGTGYLIWCDGAYVG